MGGIGSSAEQLVPVRQDLPGEGWLALDEPLDGPATTDAELLDCVGPDFPRGDEVLDSASSPHFVRPPRQLVHGLAVVFSSDPVAARAAKTLRGAAFARCLAAAVASDLGQTPDAAELLAVDVVPVDGGNRATFTGASAQGVRSVHLDVVVVGSGPALALLWFGDTPHPFPGPSRDHVIAAVAARLSSAPS